MIQDLYLKLPLVDASGKILNKKYEMRQLVISMGSIPAPENIVSAFNVGYEIDGEYVTIFHAFPPFILAENSDTVTVQWTIFKKI